MFNPIGFAVGYAFAQRYNLSPSAAVGPAILGAVSAPPWGLVLPIVLAQREAPPPAPAPAVAPAGVLRQGQAPGAGVQQQQIAAAGQQIGHQLPAPALLPPPSNVRVRAHRQQDQRVLITVDWDEVPEAQAYYVKCYRRDNPNEPWERMPRESRFMDTHRKAEFLLEPGVAPEVVRERYGFAVSATQSPYVAARESPKEVPVF
jgi:hypothetical protein